MGFQFDYQFVRWEEVRSQGDIYHICHQLFTTGLFSLFTHCNGCTITPHEVCSMLGFNQGRQR